MKKKMFENISGLRGIDSPVMSSNIVWMHILGRIYDQRSKVSGLPPSAGINPTNELTV